MMQYDETYTDYLPAKRAPREKIMESYHFFESQTYIKTIIDASPAMVMILNDCRQTVYANPQIFEVLPGKQMADLLGLRPGEIFNCIHAVTARGGCGTAKACQTCGAASSIRDCMVQNVKKQKECRITTQGNTVSGSLEFMTTSAPLIMNEEHYYIVSLTDTSHEKRRKILERVFFHDVINIAGGLKNIIELMQSPEEPSGNPELLQMADVSATSLLDEIIAQRTLVAAESGDLGINFSESCSGEILLDVQQILAKNDAASNKHIMIATNSQNIHFSTDPVLLRRVLINLAKNALEATKAGGTVIIGAKDLGKSIEFFVNNRGVIPEDVQLQIFQRSFSTKGTNRGIGTYSIKLFTEKYLKGAIRFVSNEELGTTFYVTYQKQAV